MWRIKIIFFVILQMFNSMIYIFTIDLNWMNIIELSGVLDDAAWRYWIKSNQTDTEAKRIISFKSNHVETTNGTAFQLHRGETEWDLYVFYIQTKRMKSFCWLNEINLRFRKHSECLAELMIELDCRRRSAKTLLHSRNHSVINSGSTNSSLCQCCFELK